MLRHTREYWEMLELCLLWFADTAILAPCSVIRRMITHEQRSNSTMIVFDS